MTYVPTGLPSFSAPASVVISISVTDALFTLRFLPSRRHFAAVCYLSALNCEIGSENHINTAAFLSINVCVLQPVLPHFANFGRALRYIICTGINFIGCL